MLNEVSEVIMMAVRAEYPKYYPEEVLRFFRRHHSTANIEAAIATGSLRVVMEAGRIIATGRVNGGHISGVYVRPERQRSGCGSWLMDRLEAEAAKEGDTVRLESSLPAVCWYEHRGYRTDHHDSVLLEHGVRLVYDVMEKQLTGAERGEKKS